MAKANTRVTGNADNIDIKDSPQDEKKMQAEEVEMTLPDVSDIPGQEHVQVPPLGQLADTTISSDDEEGKGLLDDDEDLQDNNMNEADALQDDTDVTDAERTALEDSANITPGEEDADGLRRATLDSTDDDGEPLNEAGFGKETSGADLDIPGAELDDSNEAVGGEDEENNPYSMGSDDNDDITEGTP